jgi:hypothetical protein
MKEILQELNKSTKEQTDSIEATAVFTAQTAKKVNTLNKLLSAAMGYDKTFSTKQQRRQESQRRTLQLQNKIDSSEKRTIEEKKEKRDLIKISKTDEGIRKAELASSRILRVAKLSLKLNQAALIARGISNAWTKKDRAKEKTMLSEHQRAKIKLLLDIRNLLAPRQERKMYIDILEESLGMHKTRNQILKEQEAAQKKREKEKVKREKQLAKEQRRNEKQLAKEQRQSDKKLAKERRQSDKKLAAKAAADAKEAARLVRINAKEDAKEQADRIAAATKAGLGFATTPAGLGYGKGVHTGTSSISETLVEGAAGSIAEEATSALTGYLFGKGITAKGLLKGGAKAGFIGYFLYSIGKAGNTAMEAFDKSMEEEKGFVASMDLALAEAHSEAVGNIFGGLLDGIKDGATYAIELMGIEVDERIKGFSLAQTLKDAAPPEKIKKGRDIVFGAAIDKIFGFSDYEKLLSAEVVEARMDLMPGTLVPRTGKVDIFGRDVDPNLIFSRERTLARKLFLETEAKMFPRQIEGFTPKQVIEAQNAASLQFPKLFNPEFEGSYTPGRATLRSRGGIPPSMAAPAGAPSFGGASVNNQVDNSSRVTNNVRVINTGGPRTPMVTGSASQFNPGRP